MKIIYRPHLKRRIKERRFPSDYPRKIYKEAKKRFFDKQTNHLIAIDKLEYAGKFRNLAISYDIIDESVEIITIHPVSGKEIKVRVASGRWKENEKS